VNTHTDQNVQQDNEVVADCDILVSLKNLCS